MRYFIITVWMHHAARIRVLIKADTFAATARLYHLRFRKQLFLHHYAHYSCLFFRKTSARRKDSKSRNMFWNKTHRSKPRPEAPLRIPPFAVRILSRVYMPSFSQIVAAALFPVKSVLRMENSKAAFNYCACITSLLYLDLLCINKGCSLYISSRISPGILSGISKSEIFILEINRRSIR